LATSGDFFMATDTRATGCSSGREPRTLGAPLPLVCGTSGPRRSGTPVLSAVLSAPTSTALVGAGSALAGVAATRIIDLEREHRAQVAQSEVSHQRDLDETRRIAYMALACRETERYELVATTVNALAHHGSAVDPDQAMTHLITIIRGGPDVDNSLAWLRGEISRLTLELDARQTGTSL